MEFNLAEKLAVVKLIDSVIHIDGVIHNGELNALSELMQVIDFDSNFIVYARNIDTEQATLILRAMPDARKNALATILEEIAEADGFVHHKETALLLDLFLAIGIERAPKKYQ